MHYQLRDATLWNSDMRHASRLPNWLRTATGRCWIVVVGRFQPPSLAHEIDRARVWYYFHEDKPDGFSGLPSQISAGAF